MSTKTERMQRRMKRGVLEFESGMPAKPGVVRLDGRYFVEHVDGRVLAVNLEKFYVIDNTLFPIATRPLTISQGRLWINGRPVGMRKGIVQHMPIRGVDRCPTCGR